MTKRQRQELTWSSAKASYRTYEKRLARKLMNWDGTREHLNNVDVWKDIGAANALWQTLSSEDLG